MLLVGTYSSIGWAIEHVPDNNAISLPPSAPIAESADSAVVRWLRQNWGIKTTTNNSVVLLQTGTEKFEDMFKAIKAARHSIHMEYFNLRNDSISNCLFEILERKVAEGVQVRVLFDWFGNSSNNRPLNSHHLEALRQKGIDIRVFDPMKFPYINHVWHRDHRKIVVIDGVVAYTGGMNVADYYLTGTKQVGEWHDLHMRVEGDIVGDLQSVFLRIWNKTSRQNISGPEYYPGYRDATALFPMLRQDQDSTRGHKLIGMVNREPHSATGKLMWNTFVKLIDSANSRIQIINPYFTLNRPVNKALKRAIKRGVRVEIMISENSDIPITPRVAEKMAYKLMKHGAEVYIFQGGFHHTKIMMIDDAVAFAGSANLDNRSLGLDYECNLLIADRPTTAHFVSLFERDKSKRCYTLTREVWKKRSRYTRFLCWLYQIFKPFL